MWRLSDAELNCVSTKIRITSELMQLEIGTSTRRYLPPSGTAGFDRSLVSGNRRLPAPPPRITASSRCLSAIGCARDLAGAGTDYRIVDWKNETEDRRKGLRVSRLLSKLW